MIRSILTVCIGNICRSPMAEGMLARDLPDLRVSSAGIGALIGHPADSNAQALMREKGIDISNHFARQITADMCRQADIVLVMENSQKVFIQSAYPFARGKVFHINEGQNPDVPDPYKLDRSAFIQSMNMIEKGALSWAEKIKKLNLKVSR